MADFILRIAGGEPISYLITTLRTSMRMSLGYYAAALLISILVFLLLRKEKPEIRFASGFLAGYLFLVLSSTVFRRRAYKRLRFRLEPLRSLRLIQLRGLKMSGALIAQIILNILMLSPIGLLLPFLEKRKWVVFICGVLFSMLIEMTQLISHRGWFDLDDIVYNTLGVLLGYGINRLVMLAVRHFQRDYALR